MEEGKFWLLCWVIVVLGIAVIFSGSIAYNHVKDRKVVQLIEGGVDPLEAKMSLVNLSDQQRVFYQSILLNECKK